MKRLYGLGATTHVATTITSNPTLESGLVGHWTFDGPDTVWANGVAATSTDRSGNSNDGTIVGATPAIGVIGQGMEFDGTSNYISTDVTIANDQNYSFAGWFNISGLHEDQEGYHNIVSTMGQGVGALYVKNPADPILGFSINYGWINNNTEVTLTPVSIGEWHHVVGINNASSSTISLYFNGMLVDSIARSSSLSGTALIGSYGDGQTPSYFWQGSLDDVRIYNRALSAEEVKRLYELGR